MKKTFVLLFIFFGSLLAATSQVLFTYGNHSVDAKDFVRVYEKNNPPPIKNKEQSVKDYLNLFIKSRLKVQEAYERGYDTLPGLISEVNNFRSQVIENYMTDPEMMARMKKEAFQRSLKDIHVAHIFISYKNSAGVTDTIAANKKKDEALARLKKGEDFLKIAKSLSDDPAVKTNNGDIGFITVFTLPYEFENIIYNTKAGKYSEVVRSKIGFHIFKNLGERKAAGKIKAQQILLAFPPGADDAAKKRIEKLADSLYKRIVAGDNFNSLATAFSNDYVSAATGGILPDISVGQYDPVFEKAVWSLSKDGALSKPFQTSHGWHIVKRITIKPVVTDPNDNTNLQEIQQKIMTDGRWKLSGDFIYNVVKSKAGFSNLPYNDDALWFYSDSLLNMRPMPPAGKTIQSTTPLFSIGNITYDATAWINYARTYRFKQDGSGLKPYPELREEWIHSTMRNYYKDNLEALNDDFREQMREFKEGNLFFEIMQREVWNKAQEDSAALLELYNANPKKYTWSQSADVVIFFCSDQSVCGKIYDEVKKDPVNWRSVTEKYSEKVVGDSSRYEWSQIPNLEKTTPKDGMLTTPVVNTTDNTASFAYIFKSYPHPVQRSFSEAKGMLINEYQEILEKKWNDALYKKYPVVINQPVLKSISQ